jgi:hypothetical protein
VAEPSSGSRRWSWPVKKTISCPWQVSCPRILSAPPAGQGIYLLGSGAWRVVDVVPVEDDLEVPVVHPMAARVWYGADAYLAFIA